MAQAMKAGTVRTVQIELGGGRVLKVARLDLEGRNPDLLLSVGFHDDSHPLVDPGALAIPADVSPALREALRELEGEE